MLFFYKTSFYTHDLNYVVELLHKGGRGKMKEILDVITDNIFIILYVVMFALYVFLKFKEKKYKKWLQLYKLILAIVSFGIYIIPAFTNSKFYSVTVGIFVVGLFYVSKNIVDESIELRQSEKDK